MALHVGVLVCLVLLPALVTTVRSAPHRLRSAGRVVPVALAALLVGVVAGAGPVEVRVADELLLRADRLSAVLALLVTVVNAVVQSYAERNVEGPARRRFLVTAAWLCSATLVVTTAATLPVLLAGWLAVSAAVHRLVRSTGTATARAAARVVRRASTVSDAALGAAVVLVVATAGDVPVHRLDTAAGELARTELLPGVSALSAAAVLLVVAAAVRCALVPAQAWLPATLAAPTPVSALLHAGVVNAGGYLLIRTVPVAGASPAAAWLALAAGAGTAAVAAVALTVRSDVKGALALSTVSQMGFMVAQVAVGAFAAAAFHLVGHALYKSALFLGAGGGIAEHTRRRTAPEGGPVLGRPARAAVAIGVPVVVLAAVELLAAPAALHGPGGPVVAAFALTAAGWSLWGWTGRGSGSPGAHAALGATAVTGALTGYLAAVSAFDVFLAPALPVPPAALPDAWWLVAGLAAAAAAAAALAAATRRRPGLAVRLHAATSGPAQRAGTLPPALRPPAPRPPHATAPHPSPALQEAR